MARSDPKAPVADYYRRVADSLIAQIERGTAPWSQAWKPGEKVLPYNIKTGKSYRGGNSVWLASTAGRRGYRDERWGTYRQVKELGGQVRRGEKGCAILYWQFELKRLARDSQGKALFDDKDRPVYEIAKLNSPRVHQYTVFNAEQADGLPSRPYRAAGYVWDRHEEVERLFKQCGASIEHSGANRAFYDLQRDRIELPFKEQFPNAPTYYQSALHELGHWTGHPNRLNRESLRQGVRQGFRSEAYAKEELRAEISSMITGDRLEIGHDPSRHASYVGAWIRSLKEDPQEIYRASKDAQDISDYLLDRGRSREQGSEDRAELRAPQGPAPNPLRTHSHPVAVPEVSTDAIPQRRAISLPLPERAAGPERSVGPDR